MRKTKKSRNVKRVRSVMGVRLTPHLSPLAVKALKYIEGNLTSIYTSTDISDALGVSREHLSRVFSHDTGTKMWEFVNRAKVERAKELLRDKSRLVKQIYPELGFGCQSTFYNAFRRYARMTPNRFRSTKLQRKKKR